MEKVASNKNTHSPQNQTSPSPRKYANRLEVHPNPVISTSYVSFDLNLQADVRVVVTNITGRQIAVIDDSKTSAGPQNITLDVSLLPPGMYFVQLYFDGIIHGVQKMLKQ